VLSRARTLLAPLSPRRRRWQRFLAGLPLTVASGVGLEAPPAEDFILCGCPRTGTTLLTAALFQPPQVVTVMEPWDGMRMPPAELFRSLHAEIETGVLRRGRLDVQTLQGAGEVRWTQEGTQDVPVATTPDWILGVKWPGYWRFLDALPETRFVVTLRHPFEVVASFKQAGGQVAQGLQYETAFNRELNAHLRSATTDPSERRVLLFDYIHERLLPHLERPNVLVVRYERWFDDADGLVAELAAFLGRELHRSPALLRRPRAAAGVLDPAELELVRRTCRTAEALGYDLGRG
jgi:hypothetical protein